MQWKNPKNNNKYFWTAHVAEKMHYYGLSEQKVLGVIRKPKRIETCIVENTVAVMMPVGEKSDAKIQIAKEKIKKSGFGTFSSDKGWNQEIWVMYQTKSQEKKFKNKLLGEKKDEKISNLQQQINSSKQITIISAWRYPGVSPKNNPIPEDILREIEEMEI